MILYFFCMTTFWALSPSVGGDSWDGRAQGSLLFEFYLTSVAPIDKTNVVPSQYVSSKHFMSFIGWMFALLEKCVNYQCCWWESVTCDTSPMC